MTTSRRTAHPALTTTAACPTRRAGVARAVAIAATLTLFGCSTLSTFFGPTGYGSSAPSVYRDVHPMPPAEEDPPRRYLGKLPWELADTEHARQKLINAVGLHDLQRAAYDDAVWLITPWLVYRLATPGWSDVNTQHQIVGSVATLGVWRSSLQERDPKREAYAQALSTLTCAMVASGEYLYTTEEFPDKGLDALLNSDIETYEFVVRDVERQIRMLPTGGRVPSCAAPGSSECRARRAAIGGSGIDRAAQASRLISPAVDFVARAQRDLVKIQALRDYVDTGSAATLRGRWLDARATLDADLHARDPGLASIQKSLFQLNQQVAALSTSLASSAPEQGDDKDKVATATATAQDVPAPARFRAWRELLPLPLTPIVSVPKGSREADLNDAETQLRLDMRQVELALATADNRSAFTRARLGELQCPAFTSAVSHVAMPTKPAALPASAASGR